MLTQIVACDVRVAGVETNGDGRVILEPRNQLGNLLKAAAERELRAGCVLNEDVEWAVSARAGRRWRVGWNPQRVSGLRRV